MNLPNKITVTRIIISILLLIMMITPFYELGIDFPTYLVAGKISINLKYIICGIVFIIASLTDTLDGYLARKNNEVTDFGKTMDAIADKLLVNGILIVLACDGFISVAIPVIIITRDIFVDAIKMVASKKGPTVAASKIGKVKTILMMTGVSLMLLYNLPFELIGINISYGLIILATIFSLYSGVEYFVKNKKYITEDM